MVGGSRFFFLPRQDLQTQQTIHGDARSSRGDVTKAMTPRPTRIPTTWRCRKRLIAAADSSCILLHHLLGTGCVCPPNPYVEVPIPNTMVFGNEGPDVWVGPSRQVSILTQGDPCNVAYLPHSFHGRVPGKEGPLTRKRAPAKTQSHGHLASDSSLQSHGNAFLLFMPPVPGNTLCGLS